MQTVIESIMDNFDFQKVHSTMETLNWCWYTNDISPAIPELRRTARRLLQTVAEFDDEESVHSGGFRASKRRGEDNKIFLQLEFIVENFETCKELVDEQESEG